jgi:hypothetical protein
LLSDDKNIVRFPTYVLYKKLQTPQSIITVLSSPALGPAAKVSGYTTNTEVTALKAVSKVGIISVVGTGLSIASDVKSYTGTNRVVLLA